jgi:hypothetical protein
MLNFDLKTLDPTIFITSFDLIIFPNVIHIIYLKNYATKCVQINKSQEQVHIQISTFTF